MEAGGPSDFLIKHFTLFIEFLFAGKVIIGLGFRKFLVYFCDSFPILAARSVVDDLAGGAEDNGVVLAYACTPQRCGVDVLATALKELADVGHAYGIPDAFRDTVIDSKPGLSLLLKYPSIFRMIFGQ